MTDLENDPEFVAYAEQVREELLPKLEKSAMTVSLVPAGVGDIKFALELGLSIMLDKPIILMVPDNRGVPEHLLRVADEVVSGDPTNPAVATELHAAIERVLRDLRA